MSEKCSVLNCRSGSCAVGIAPLFMAIIVAATASPSIAQEKPQLKRPQQTSDEKPAETKKPKNVKGPRAVGILQLRDGKATLIPVAILVDGKFHDATVYKAEPVPLALESGTVYEAEQAGESQGLFTTNGAVHSKATNSVSPWWGTGQYLPNGTEAARTTRTAEDVPVGMDNSGDEPPRLTRKSAAGGSGPPASAAPPTSAPQSTESPDTTRSSEKGSSIGGSSDDKKNGTSTTSDKETDQNEKKQPSTQTGAEQRPAEQGSSSEASRGQEAENYYRPTLRRGKPTEAAPEERDPVPKAAAIGSLSPPGGVPGAKVVQIMAAISDSGGPDPQSYKFFWKAGEEEERRKQMLSLAGDELRAYVNARTKGAIVAVAPVSKPADPKRKAAGKPLQPVFEDIRFATFDLWKNNQPVMIMSAQAHFPSEPGAAVTPESYSITMVSRTDIYGSLRKLYSGVTDRFHMDVTPRLELIDVVDADGDGRGELLFHEITDAGDGYVIYRATGDKLWKLFDSTRAE